MRHNTDVDISKVKKDMEALRNDVAQIKKRFLMKSKTVRSALLMAYCMDW